MQVPRYKYYSATPNTLPGNNTTVRTNAFHFGANDLDRPVQNTTNAIKSVATIAGTILTAGILGGAAGAAAGGAAGKAAAGSAAKSSVLKAGKTAADIGAGAASGSSILGISGNSIAATAPVTANLSGTAAQAAPSLAKTMLSGGSSSAVGSNSYAMMGAVFREIGGERGAIAGHIVKRQNLQDSAVVRDSLNDVGNKTRDFMNGLDQRQGPDSEGIHTDTQSFFESVYKEKMESMTPRQQQIFQTSFANYAQKNLDRAFNIQEKNVAIYSKNAVTAQNLNLTEDAMSNWNDKDTVIKNAQLIIQNTKSLNPAARVGADVQQQQVRVATGAYFDNVLTRAAQQDPHAAAEMFNEYSKYLPENKKIAMQEKIKVAASSKALEDSHNIIDNLSISQLELLEEQTKHVTKDGKLENTTFISSDITKHLSRDDRQKLQSGIKNRINQVRGSAADSAFEKISKGQKPSNSTLITAGVKNPQKVQAILDNPNVHPSIKTKVGLEYKINTFNWSQNPTVREYQKVQLKQEILNSGQDYATMAAMNGSLELQFDSMFKADKDDYQRYVSTAKSILKPSDDEGQPFSVVQKGWFNDSYDAVKSQTLYNTAIADLQEKLKYAKTPLEAEKMTQEVKDKYDKEISVQQYQYQMNKYDAVSNTEYLAKRLLNDNREGAKTLVKILQEKPEQEAKIVKLMTKYNLSPDNVMVVLNNPKRSKLLAEVGND